jgi:hypothetical protein
MKITTKHKKPVKITKKPIKAVARNNNNKQSTLLRNRLGTAYDCVSTHVYIIVDRIITNKINSYTYRVIFKILNIDTQNIVTKKGYVHKWESGDSYGLDSPLEGFKNISSVPRENNIPCEIICFGSRRILWLVPVGEYK